MPVQAAAAGNRQSSRKSSTLTTGLLRHTMVCSIYLSILWAGVQPTLDPYAEALFSPPSYIRVRAIVWACGRGQTHRQTDTDARDHNTFLVVFDSREM